MIKTFKVKHNKDFSVELQKAFNVAVFTKAHKCTSSAEVKQFGLKAIISNQIIRKIKNNKKLKQIKHVNLIIPNQGINYKHSVITIPSLKLKLNFFIKGFSKINQIEIDKEFAYISCSFNDAKTFEAHTFIGVDLNTTGHMVVAANPVTGKVYKLNKKSSYIRSKYRAIRKTLQKRKQYKTLKRIRNREQRICKDLDNKASTYLVKLAKTNKCGLRLENLSNIRETTKNKTKAFKAALNNWSFYQFRKMIEYKAKLHGVIVEFIDPKYTSQADSRTGHLGIRNAKVFRSNNRLEHADVNAAFNIALNQLNIAQLRKERDLRKRYKNKNSLTDLPQEATSNKSLTTLEPHVL